MATFTLGPVIGDVLPNATLVSVKGSTDAVGDLDLYTVPANRRAYLSSSAAALYNNGSGGTIARYLEVKISGTYYRITSTTTIIQNVGGVITMTSPIFLDAGQTLTINTAISTGNGFPLNYSASVVEFDATAKVKSAMLAGLSSGNNTLYTCPASTTTLFQPPPLLASISQIALAADSGGTRNYYFNLVPNGGSVSAANQFIAATSLSASAVTSSPVYGGMVAGDFININVDTGAATQFAWVNILERAV